MKSSMKTFRQFFETNEEVAANNAVATPGISGFDPESVPVRKKQRIKIIRRTSLPRLSNDRR